MRFILYNQTVVLQLLVLQFLVSGLFTTEKNVNCQIDSILNKVCKIVNSSDGIAARNAHTASVMVFGCIESNWKFPLVFVDAAVKIKQNIYFYYIPIREVLT